MTRIRRFIDDTDGVAAVEFALIGIPLVMLLIGLVEFGRAIHIRSAMDNAVDRAQRMIIIDPLINITDLTTRIRQNFAAGNSDALVVGVSDMTSSGTNYRLVSLTYDMQLLLPISLGRDISLTMNRRVAINP